MPITANVLLDCVGTALTDSEKDLIRHPAAAGVILFTRNYDNPQQLTELTAQIKAVNPNALITVDQEGGRVQRFIDGFTRLPSMRFWGQQYLENPSHCLKEMQNIIRIMMDELSRCGVPNSLLPVLDLDYQHNDIIGERSFSHDPDLVTTLAKAFIQALHENGVKATAKHFPGHGMVRHDSHAVLPEDHRSFEEIKNSDLKPFAQLVSDYDAVMPAHIVFSKVDHRPAGFSPVWLRDILRKQLGFTGVIMSDDLSMAGAASIGSYTARAEAAVAAGCDLLLVCNNQSGAIEVLECMEKNYNPDVSARIAHFINPCHEWIR